jgi:Zn-dependent membrane protease YugP
MGKKPMEKLILRGKVMNIFMVGQGLVLWLAGIVSNNEQLINVGIILIAFAPHIKEKS